MHKLRHNPLGLQQLEEPYGYLPKTGWKIHH
jgi:hypothetical protein